MSNGNSTDHFKPSKLSIGTTSHGVIVFSVHFLSWYHPARLSSSVEQRERGRGRETSSTSCQKVNGAVFLTFAPPGGELGML